MSGPGAHYQLVKVMADPTMNYVDRAIMSNNLHLQLKFSTCLFYARPSCLSFIRICVILSNDFFLQLKFTQKPTYPLLDVWLFCIAAVWCQKPT